MVMNVQTLEHFNQTLDMAKHHAYSEFFHERLDYCKGMLAALRIENVIDQSEYELYSLRVKAVSLSRYALGRAT